MSVTLKKDRKSRIEGTPIYEFLKEYISYIPVQTLRKGQYLFHGEGSDSTIYYLLKGTVEVENVTPNGKRLIIENVKENNFIGPISNIYKVELKSSGLAIDSVEVLVFRKSLLDKLMENDKFRIFFYEEITERIYKMYKGVLARLLFSPSEIMAYHIFSNTEGNVFAYKGINKLCEFVGISKRGVYDILYRLEEMGCLKKQNTGIYIVLDKAYLRNQAKYIIDFMSDNSKMLTMELSDKCYAK